MAKTVTCSNVLDHIGRPKRLKEAACEVSINEQSVLRHVREFQKNNYPKSIKSAEGYFGVIRVIVT